MMRVMRGVSREPTGAEMLYQYRPIAYSNCPQNVEGWIPLPDKQASPTTTL